MILADGKTVYFGDRDKATSYFSKLGYECPNFINPADYLMKVVQVNPNAIEGVEEMSDVTTDTTFVSCTHYHFYPMADRFSDTEHQYW